MVIIFAIWFCISFLRDSFLQHLITCRVIKAYVRRLELIRYYSILLVTFKLFCRRVSAKLEAFVVTSQFWLLLLGIPLNGCVTTLAAFLRCRVWSFFVPFIEELVVVLQFLVKSCISHGRHPLRFFIAWILSCLEIELVQSLLLSWICRTLHILTWHRLRSLITTLWVGEICSTHLR